MENNKPRTVWKTIWKSIERPRAISYTYVPGGGGLTSKSVSRAALHRTRGGPGPPSKKPYTNSKKFIFLIELLLWPIELLFQLKKRLL